MAPKQSKSSDTTDEMQTQIQALQEQLASLQASMRPTPAPSSFESEFVTKLPPIQLITPKLDGKRTYRTWSTNIEAVAQSIEHIWNIIQDDRGPASQQQYARSLLLLNMVPSIQAECRSMTSAHEMWTYLKGQFDTNEFADLAIAVRRLRNIKWSASDSRIEDFYQEFKDAQMTIREVTGQPLHELVMISILLQALEDRHPEFSSLVEAQLSHPTTQSAQKTFEYVFGRFRTEHYRAKARYDSEQILAVKQYWQNCAVCKKRHGKDCWTKNPELAPEDLREYYQRKHEEWKPKADKPTIELVRNTAVRTH